MASQKIDQKIEPSSRRIALRNPGSLNDLRLLAKQSADSSQYKLATTFKASIPHYDLSTVSQEADSVSQLQDEWYQVLNSGPGVLILQNFAELKHIQQANKVFDKIIEEEATSSKGDHFAASGANSRIWNSFQKHALADPASFVNYYANPWLAKICEAWLGPGYQVTAQVNVVRPGGKPQNPHRDYHLGFQTNEACAQYPRSAHLMSQYLTLQGAVAHSDMPLASGPTRFLPFSQLLPEGYMAWRDPEVMEFFEKNWVSVPLSTGDAVFFNPALVHAAGENTTTDVQRSANLLQISSAFGRAMEHVNTPKIIKACWDDLVGLCKAEGESERVKACVAAMAEAYPFPSNLDIRQPGPGGMAPISEVDVLWQGLRQEWTRDETAQAIDQLKTDSRY
ncbi:hypothetical protein GGR57DRAFT_340990 [Xylariaceae sp. FL1272]|nr:hypothetical protein GGR57DRAFT_340990 [Xylariaceae sp. FL1272]